MVRGDLLDAIYRLGVVEAQDHITEGTRVRAKVPMALQQKLAEFIVTEPSLADVRGKPISPSVSESVEFEKLQSLL